MRESIASAILWEGKVPITSFHFNFSTNNNYQLPEEELADTKAIWKAEKEKFPQAYDGDLVYIDNMSINSPFTFNAGIMKWSSLVYLVRTGQSFNNIKGYLSFSIILYYKEESEVRYLIGMKASTSQFNPNNWTMPGGVVEIKDKETVDLTYSVKKEIIEETGLSKIDNAISCHLLTKGGRHLGIGMILSLEIDPQEIDSIRENEEFQPSSFSWLTNKEILNLSDDTILDDVSTLKYLIQNNGL